MGDHQGDTTVGYTKPVHTRAKSADFLEQYEELPSSRLRIELLYLANMKHEIIEEFKDVELFQLPS